MLAFPATSPVLSPASPQARALSELFTLALGVCGVIFAIVVALIVWCLVRYRKRPSAEGEPRQVDGNHRLEISWTLASIAVLVLLFAVTVGVMHRADAVATRDPDVTVIGHQWWWEVRYADGTVTANEIHIAAGADVLVRVDSADVIHSFWVPQLGRKMDAIPGHPNELWIRADEPGEYVGACSEFCGVQHAWMRLLVVAQSADDFRAWSAAQAARPAPVASHGASLFHDKACGACHAIGALEAPRAGPDLTHFASRATLGAGVLANTPPDLERWLRDPQAIKPGCHMPDFQLSDADAADLTSYLETLQ